MATSGRTSGDRALFDLAAGGCRYRCPACDAVTATEPDTACSAFCTGLARRSARGRGDQ